MEFINDLPPKSKQNLIDQMLGASQNQDEVDKLIKGNFNKKTSRLKTFALKWLKSSTP